MTLLELFDTKEKWTQYAIALDDNDFSVNPRSTRAVRWCLLGGLEKCYGGPVGFDIDYHSAGYSDAVSKIEKAIASQADGIDEWNDALDRTFEDVIDLLKTCGV